MVLARCTTLLVAFFGVTPSCAHDPAAAAPKAAAASAQESASSTPGPKNNGDADIQTFQAELLAIAWQAASSYPTVPHRRRRARAQALVADACFRLGRPEQALAFGNQIDDWRRGCVYADYIYHCARRGGGPDLAAYAPRAEDLAKREIADQDSQQWYGHLILLKLARAHRALGDEQSAARVSAMIDEASATAVDPEWTEVASERVAWLTREQAKRDADVFATSFGSLSLGRQHTALAGMTQLHARFYGDRELREQIEGMLLRNEHRALPDMQFDVLHRLAETHVEQRDLSAACRVIGALQKHHEGLKVEAGLTVRNLARLARLRALAGEADWARKLAAEAMTAYHTGLREAVWDYERAETLRPLAFAWHAIGEKTQANDLLQLLLEEGAENPNARPRCEDLVETCLTMAVQAIEPLPPLLARMREIGAGLKDPW